MTTTHQLENTWTFWEIKVGANVSLFGSGTLLSGSYGFFFAM